MLLLPELAPSYSGKMYVGGSPGCSAKVMIPPLADFALAVTCRDLAAAPPTAEIEIAAASTTARVMR
jgi:hypothetical protein